MRNIVGSVTQGEDFFAREKTTKKINYELKNGNHILLSAPSKMGKTSLLRHLCQRPGDDFNFVYFDAKPVNTREDFYHYCLQAICSTLKMKVSGKVSNKDEFRQQLYAIGGKKPLVIVVDEFPRMLLNIRKYDGENWARDFLQQLQAIRRDPQLSHIRFIYSATVYLTAMVAKLDLAHLTNDLLTIEIPALSKEEATRFVGHLLQNSGLFTSANAIDYLLDTLQWLIPFHIQLLFREIAHLAIDENSKKVTSNTIDVAFKQLLDHHFTFARGHDRIKNLFGTAQYQFAEALLNSLAQQSNITLDTIVSLASKNNVEDEYQDVLRVLIQDGVIACDDQRQLYHFNSGLLRGWWQRQLPQGLKSRTVSELSDIKIRTVKIENIKCFDTISIDFDPGNNMALLTGLNARGKTTILQLIALGLSGVNIMPFPYSWRKVVKSGCEQGHFSLDILFEGKPVHLTFTVNDDDSIICTEGDEQLQAIKARFFLAAYGANRHIKLEDPRPHPAVEAIATLFGENGYLKHIKVSETFAYVTQDFATIQQLVNAVLAKAEAEQTAQPVQPVQLLEYDAQSLYFNTATSDKIAIEGLSEGFKSTFVWLFDLIIRMVEKSGDLTNAQTMTGIVMLDEVDLHLHPGWQRTILPSLNGLFPNIQFIVTSHSPFVAQSINSDNINSLEWSNGQVIVESKDMRSELSYAAMVREVFNIQSPFSHESAEKIQRFRELQSAIVQNQPFDEAAFKQLVLEIADRGLELEGVMRREIQSLQRRTGREFNLWKK